MRNASEAIDPRGLVGHVVEVQVPAQWPDGLGNDEVGQEAGVGAGYDGSGAVQGQTPLPK